MTKNLQSQTWTSLGILRETRDPFSISSPESIPRLAKDETYGRDILQAWNADFGKQEGGGGVQDSSAPAEAASGDSSVSTRNQMDSYGCIFPYECNGEEMSGYLVVPSYLKECNFAISHKVPVVIMFHTGAGPQDIFNRFQADKLARESIWGEKGCIIFIADMISDSVGWSWGDRQRYWAVRAKLIKVIEKNGENQRFQLREKLGSIMSTIQSIEIADHNRVAAIGFCLGGVSILELGRMKCNGILGLISFHGLFDGFQNSDKSEDDNVTWKEKPREVLICNGSNDPYVPKSDLVGAKQVFEDAGWNAKLLNFNDVVHNFSNPRTKYDDPDGSFGYDESATTTSWIAAVHLLQKVFEL